MCPWCWKVDGKKFQAMLGNTVWNYTQWIMPLLVTQGIRNLWSEKLSLCKRVSGCLDKTEMIAGITSTNLFGKNFSPRFSETQFVCWSFALIFDSHTSLALFYIKTADLTQLHCLGSTSRPAVRHWCDNGVGGGREKPGCFSSLCFKGHLGVSIFSTMVLQMLFQVSISVGLKVSQGHLALALLSEQWRVSLTSFKHVSGLLRIPVILMFVKQADPNKTKLTLPFKTARKHTQ